MAKEGYVKLLAIQKRHAADPGDGKAMVRARRALSLIHISQPC